MESDGWIETYHFTCNDHPGLKNEVIALGFRE
jgi:hypothetical protein